MTLEAPQPAERARNIQIYQDLLAIISWGHRGYETGEIQLFIPHVPERNVNISHGLLSELRPTHTGYFADVPETMEFPVNIVVWVSQSIHEIDTPYGKLSNVVIGADRNLYTFTNTVFINFQGLASVLQSVTKLQMHGDQTLEDQLKDWDLEETEIQQVSFIPKEEDTRHQPMDQDTADRLRNLIEEVKAGTYSEFPYGDQIVPPSVL